MDMVERVARALYAIRMELAEGANLPQYTWETERNPYREHCLREARAAIEAMREPTDRMGAAGLKVQNTPYGEPPKHNNPVLTAAEMDAINFASDHLAANPSRWMKPTWRAMIDAALTSHTDTPKET